MTFEEKPVDLLLFDPADSERPVVTLANRILRKAIKKSASEVQVEPDARSLVIRLRLDGELQVEDMFAKQVALQVAARFRNLARIDREWASGEGRFSVKLEKRFFAVVCSITSARYGDKIVMRIVESIRPGDQN
ncbi:MAG: hypothetical protein HY646_15985 [Acidobacteria bacterium]|nr:hypothetical protein [Acidobacteriota bacterium]